MQEVGGVFVVGLGIDEGQPAGLAVGKGGDGAHLGNQPRRLLVELVAAGQAASSRDRSNCVALIMAERIAMGWAAGGKPSKWCFMSSCRFSFCVSRSGKFLQLRLRGQLPIYHQVGGLDETGFDRPVPQSECRGSAGCLLAVDECDGAPAGAGVGVAIVQGDVAGRVAQAEISTAFSRSVPVTMGRSNAFPSNCNIAFSLIMISASNALNLSASCLRQNYTTRFFCPVQIRLGRSTKFSESSATRT